MLGERELGLEGTARKVIASVQSAGVSDPLVDEDESGRVGDDQVSEDGARIGAGVVGIGHQGIAFGAAELPGQLSPERVDDRAVRLLPGLPRSQLVADNCDALDRSAEEVGWLLVEQPLHVLRKGGEIISAEEMPDREHGVRLAATESGLQVDHGRRVAVAGQPACRESKEGTQAIGEIGAREELDRVGVVAGADTVGNLMQVGRELGTGKVAAGDVCMRAKDLSPRHQVGGGESGHRRGVAGVAARFLAVGGTLHVETQLAHTVGLGRGVYGSQQPLTGIECPVGVIGTERLLVRPLVAYLAHFSGEVLLGSRENLAEGEPKGSQTLSEDPQLHLGIGAFVGLAAHAITGGEQFGPIGHFGREQGKQHPVDHRG